MRLLLIPFLGWAVAYGLRSFYYEQENDRIDADYETQRQDRNEALRFGSDPLAVVGYAYLTGVGSCGVASAMAQAGSALQLQASVDGNDVIRHSALAVAGDDEDPGRCRACFRNLIDSISDAVRAIPQDVPFGVRLQISDDVDCDAVLSSWQACWEAEGLRAAKATQLLTDTGVMALDEWLDNRGGSALEKFLLFVAVQLHDTFPRSGTEAGVAMVLGWAPLVRRRHVTSIALLHRPVETEQGAINPLISTALQWGNTTGDKVKDLWQTGLVGPDKASVAKSMSDLSIGVSLTEGLSGIHDLDTTIGYSGNAAGWLAIALGIEHAKQNNNPQLIAWREGSLRFAVVQPVAQAGRMASEG